MGGGSWSGDTYESFTSSVKSAPRASVFKSRSCKEEFDPKNIVQRQSLITDEHPNPTPIVVAFDVTGSMHGIPDKFVRELLGDLMDTLNDSGVVTDPQVCVCAVGDAYSDRSPLQISHFESDNRVSDHLSDLYLEGGGGGGGRETYELAWHWFAQEENTDLQCLTQGRKGIFFTIGDEMPYQNIPASIVKKVTGKAPQGDTSFNAVVSQIDERFEAFHIMISQGGNFSTKTQEVWRAAIGERAIFVDDYTTICDVIKGICLMVNGASLEDAVSVATNKKSTETALAPLENSGTVLVRASGTGTATALAKGSKSSRRL